MKHSSTEFKHKWLSSYIRPVIVVVVLGILLALSGCSSNNPTPTTVPTKTPKPTFTPDRPTIIALPTETPSPTIVLPTPTYTPVPTPTQDPNINPLTGLHVEDPAVLQRRPIHARIGNDPSIRPQEGLGAADIVYEDIMDGWALTRFTAVFLAEDPPRIRPLRSARLVSLELAPQYDAALVHTGASDPIRFKLSESDIRDLDEYFNSKPYSILEGYDWRGRFYTDSQRIHDYLEEKGWETSGPSEGFVFSTEGSTPPGGAPASTIHIPYPKLCVTDWAFDPDAGVYLREVQGTPHLDGNTDEQIRAANVIIFYARHEATDIVEDSLGNTAINIVLRGEGRVQICRDGVVIDGKWQRNELQEFTRFLDNDGKLIPLKPGKTWVQLVPVEYEVVIK
ncbi:MAG: DUF3048 domain-containing protein [Anaerolineae bacterium]|nr:DUF3048 domain-containing protein [Anaerolineae bacterium]